MSEPDSYLVAFGLAVKEARKQDGRTQAEAAYAVDVSRTYFSHIEQGKAASLSLSLARRISDAFAPGAVRLDPGPDLRPVFKELLQRHAARTYDTFGDETPDHEDVGLIWMAEALLAGGGPVARPPKRPAVDDLVAEMERHRRLAGASTDALIRALRAERETLAADAIGR